mgnify:FL=1|jgi:hypothetical protein
MIFVMLFFLCYISNFASDHADNGATDESNPLFKEETARLITKTQQKHPLLLKRQS